MLLETIRLTFINMLICSNIFNTIFNTKFGSFKARNVVFTNYVSTETINISHNYEPDFDYLEMENSIINGPTVHKFSLVKFIEDTNGFESLLSNQDMANLKTETKDGLIFFIQNLNFEISYTCSNPTTNAVNGGKPDKYSVLGIPAFILSKDEKHRSVSIKFVVNFSRVKNIIIDGTNLVNNFYKGLEKKEDIIAGVSVYPYPSDEKVYKVYERYLKLNNKMISLNATEILKKKDINDKKSVDEDYPLLGVIEITRKISASEINIFDSIPKKLTDPLGFFMKGSSIANFEVMLNHLINEKETELEFKKIRELSRAAYLVKGMKKQEDYKINLTPIIPKKSFSNINTFMCERRKELLEKFNTDVVFFTTLFLLNRPPKIQIKGFEFTIENEKLIDFNIVNLYKLCEFLKGKDEIKSAMEKIILANSDNKGLLIPGTIYRSVAFSSNGVDTSKNQEQSESSSDSKTTQEEKESKTKKQSKTSGVIIVVAISVVAIGAIGGLVYSFIL